jgi:hypothetical protein
VTICSDRFEVLARATATGLGMPNLPLVIVPHPIGGISAAEVITKTDGILENLMKQLLN